jgi:O-antigen ligase
MTVASLPALWNDRAAADAATSNIAISNAASHGAMLGWSFWLTALVVGGAFFVSESDVRISLADAYTQTAEQMEAATSGGNMLRRFAFVGVAALGFGLLCHSRQRPWQLTLPLAAGMLAFALWCATSLLWSINPGMCVRRLLVFGFTFIGGLGIARTFSMRQLSQLALVAVGSIVCIGVLAEIRYSTFRPWSGDYRFSGSVHPNTQGMYLTVVALSAWGLSRTPSKYRVAYWLALAVAMVLLVLTKSRTSLAGAILAFGAVLTLQTSLRLKVLAGFSGVWLLTAVLLAVLLVGIDPVTDFRDAALLGRAEESESFSGRLSIWPEVLYYISKTPVVGHGYESFWTAAHIDTIFDALGWGVREAHNGYLEVLLATGIVGLGLLLGAVLAGLVTTARGYLSERDPTYCLPFGMLVFGLFDSTMESGMAMISLGTFLIACCLLRSAFFAEPPAPQPNRWLPANGLYPLGASP